MRPEGAKKVEKPGRYVFWLREIGDEWKAVIKGADCGRIEEARVGWWVV